MLRPTSIGIVLALLLCLHGCGKDHEASCDALLANAHSLSEQHDYKQAQECLHSALLEAQLSSQSWQKPRVLREIADNYLAQGDATNAESTARSLIQIYDGQATKTGMSRAERTDLADDRSTARVLLARALAKEKRYDEALAVLKQAKDEMSSSFGSVTLQADIDSQCLSLLHAEGKLPEEKDNYENEGLAKTDCYFYRDRGNEVLDKGNIAEGLQDFKTAQSKAQVANDLNLYADTTISLALAEIFAHNTTAARNELAKLSPPSLQRPITKARFLAVSAFLAPTKAEAVKSFAAAKRIDESTAIFQLKCLAVGRPGDFPSQVSILRRLTPIAPRTLRLDLMWHLVSIVNNDKTKAEAIQFFSSQARNSSIALEEYATCLECLGSLQHEDHPQESDRLYEEAIQIRNRLKDSDIDEPLAAKAELAQDYLNLRHPKQAIKVAESGLKLAAPGPDLARRKVKLIDKLAQSYYAVHDYQKSAEMLEEAAAFSRENKLEGIDKLEQREKEVARLAKQSLQNPYSQPK